MPYFRAMKARLLLLLLCLPFIGFGQCVGNCLNGQGTYTWANGTIYVGEWKGGEQSGQGTLTWANGDKYVGERKDNESTGQGTYTWANGNKYVGEWKDNERTGQGTYTWANGNKYVGEWKEGKKNGQGTYTWANGTIYVGEYKDNERTGQGTLTWENGDFYDGDFIKGLRSGKGMLVRANGNVYEGDFVGSKITGKGKVTWAGLFGYGAHGDVYEGEFVGGGANGQGTYTWANGNKYIGEFKDGERTGQGTMTSPQPPILSLSDIQFIDENSNNAIDAFEENSLIFSLNNTGPGYGSGLITNVSISGNIQGIDCKENHALATVEPGNSMNYSIPISSSRFTADGSIIINIEVIEPKGFSPEPFALEINTRAFRAPKLEVVDFSSSITTWGPNTPIGLDVLIQNTGEGTAENVEVELKLPNAVNCYSSNLSLQVTYIAPGETLPITYDMIVPRNFDQNNVTANITVTEKFGDYGSTWNHNFPFKGGSNGTNVIAIEAEANESIEIDRASLNSRNNKTADVSFNQVPKDIVVNTVAVLPIDGKDCNGNTVSGQDIASFTEASLLGLYNVVERRNLERVLDEQKLALSGILFEKSAVEAGCNVGAQGIIFAEYGCLTGQETIQLKLVDCQTSELYWSAIGVNATAKQTLDKVREELGKD